MTKYLNPTTHPGLIYIFGHKDITTFDPEDIIDVKIGLSDNNPVAFNQRLGEHQRHRPDDIELAAIPSTQRRDAPVRHHLCRTFPDKFKSRRGKGREVVFLRAKDWPFLLEQATRFLNGTNTSHNALLSYPMRQEQEDCCHKTCSFFSDPNNLRREFLWDCKMRFGKTHTSYQVITHCNFKTVLILTGFPTDTKKAWLKDMDHIAFDFGPDNFIDTSLTSEPIVPFENDTTIIFCSTQDLDLNKEKFQHFANINFDLIIKDEADRNFDTPRFQEIISQLQYKHLLALSGTPYRALLMERYAEDAVFHWSYTEEQKARQQEIETLGLEEARKSGQYYWLAPLTIHTISLSETLYKDAELFTEEEGFTFTKLFTTSKDAFLHDTNIDAFLNSLSHGLIMPYSPQAQEHYNALNLKDALWYVPGVLEAKLLAMKLRLHPIFKQFKIVVAAGDNNDGAGRDTVFNTENAISNIETGFDDRHVGTITLTCGKLHRGVSIPQWGSVLCLSDMGSAPLYFQLIFRCQTPWKDGSKEECYVFDFNPNRTLHYFDELARVQAKTGNIREALAELLKVFNVLCYEDNGFVELDATNVIQKLNDGFGRFNSSSTLQHIFDALRFELDAELVAELESIDDGSALKPNTIQINNHDDIPNGKNTRPSQTNGLDEEMDMDESEEKDSQQKLTAIEQQQQRARMAAKQIPMLISLLSVDSYDELIDTIDNEERAKKLCHQSTGISSRVLKKMLEKNVPNNERHRINRCLVGMRSIESSSHNQYQSELELL